MTSTPFFGCLMVLFDQTSEYHVDGAGDDSDPHLPESANDILNKYGQFHGPVFKPWKMEEQIPFYVLSRSRCPLISDKNERRTLRKDSLQSLIHR